MSEARRLASLQKRRELRAAGIMAGGGGWRFRKRGLVDYNAEVPFEKPTPAGFHDPSDDRFDKNETKRREPEKRRDVKETEDRRKDKEKLKKRKYASYFNANYATNQ